MFVLDPAVTFVGATVIVPEPSAAWMVTVGEVAIATRVPGLGLEFSLVVQVAPVPTAGTVTAP